MDGWILSFGSQLTNSKVLLKYFTVTKEPSMISLRNPPILVLLPIYKSRNNKYIVRFVIHSFL
jgi:hypothetical protein